MARGESAVPHENTHSRAAETNGGNVCSDRRRGRGAMMGSGANAGFLAPGKAKRASALSLFEDPGTERHGRRVARTADWTRPELHQVATMSFAGRQKKKKKGNPLDQARALPHRETMCVSPRRPRRAQTVSVQVRPPKSATSGGLDDDPAAGGARWPDYQTKCSCVQVHVQAFEIHPSNAASSRGGGTRRENNCNRQASCGRKSCVLESRRLE